MHQVLLTATVFKWAIKMNASSGSYLADFEGSDGNATAAAIRIGNMIMSAFLRSIVSFKDLTSLQIHFYYA